jgi:predicted DCC family thiol-disulfide oxidoreductase YuxK
MSAIAKAWSRFWFMPVPVRRVAVLRLLVAGYALWDVVIATGFFTRYGDVDGAFWLPIVLLQEPGVGPLGPEALSVLQVATAVTLLLATVGFRTRLALCIAAPLYTLWWANFVSFGAIQGGRLTIVVALFALAIAPAGRALSIDALLERRRRARPGEPLPQPLDERDPIAGWALRAVMVFVVLAYTSAAWAKLRTSGIDWPTGGALEAALLGRETTLADAVAAQTTLVHVMAASTLALEASAWLALLKGRVRDVILLSLAGFHIGSLFLLGINFMPFVLTYAAFYDLEVGAERVGAFARRLAAQFGPSLRVFYDGQCTLCVRSITLVQGLDWFGRLRFVDASLDPSQPLDSMYVEDGRRRHRGYRAARRMSRVVPAFWPALPFSLLPGMTALGDRVYERVAVNRGRNGSCALPNRTEPEAEPGACATPAAPAVTTASSSSTPS